MIQENRVESGKQASRQENVVVNAGAVVRGRKQANVRDVLDRQGSLQWWCNDGTRTNAYLYSASAGRVRLASATVPSVDLQSGDRCVFRRVLYGGR